MHRKLQNMPVWKQYLYSLLLSSICLGAAMAVAFVYHALLPESHFAILLFFLLAVLITSHCITSFSVLLLKDISNQHRKLLSESEIEKMRANLLRSISHDLRTPLAVIIGNSSLYLDSTNQLSETEKAELLTNIHEEADWLLNVVENLLVITRIQKDSFSIATRPEALEEVIAEALQKFKKHYPDVAVKVQIPESYISLPMDAILIEQVMINLLSNASLHSGSPTPIEVTVRDMPHAVSVSIKDYGNGIPQEKLDSLFDGTSYPVSGKGTGVGLSICQTIIAAHHGTILGRNHKTGAEFVFTLPKS
ncbi:MAG: ATP-binding protein [Lachnoclostridium sp.]|nr:ATP-binding protein [Lachnospira sp.]MCM1247374.1 ATP-binding protein [Lachnoclostridium sp.]MCM1535533.1 ATP-binding protein [Clostridium sp.]